MLSIPSGGRLLMVRRILLSLAAGAALFASQLGAATHVPKPPALVADGIPPVPRALADRTRPYMEYRTAVFQGWHPGDRSMLISTRFANTVQIHRVAAPGGARTQLTFEPDRVPFATWAPEKAEVLVVQKDVG